MRSDLKALDLSVNRLKSLLRSHQSTVLIAKKLLHEHYRKKEFSLKDVE